MRNRKIAVMAAFGAALVLALLLAMACGGGGASQADLDAAKQQLADKEKEAALLQSKVTELEGTAGAASDVTALISAKKLPALTPTPVPSPTPAGQTPKPKTTPPASYGEPVPFSFYVEVLATATRSKFDIASTVACTPSSVFKRGQRMVWRFEVVDISTGKRLTDADAPTIKVTLPNGDEATGRFSQRAGGKVPDAPWMWGANWDIPLDYPLGGIDYAITVTTKDGRTGTFKTPALIMTDGSIDSRPKVVA